MRTLALWLASGLFVFVLGGCVSSYDSGVHPRRLVPVQETVFFRFVDLDGDGRDHLIRRGAGPTGKENSVLLQSLSGRATAQVHFNGRLLTPRYLDVTEDGQLEVIVPVVHGDSLFYNVLSATGERLNRFFAASGTARREPGGTMPWDIRGAFLRSSDVTGDGSPELISFFKTGFARQPRGVWVHSYPEGRLIGHQRVGALPNGGTLHFGNVDDDSAPEWLFGSLATNNGAVGGGMSDSRAYVGAIEVTGSPQVQWAREMGETFSAAELRYGDLDNDGRPEFVALRKPREGRQTKSPLHQIDPNTGETIQRYDPKTIVRAVAVGALGEDGRDRVLIRGNQGRLRLLNQRFEVIRQRSFEQKIQSVSVLPDVTGDDRDEVVVRTERGGLLLDANLSIQAATRLPGRWSVVETGVGRRSRVAVRREDGHLMHFRIDENRFWRVYRYGPAVGLLLGVVAVVGGAVVGARRYHRFRRREAVHEHVAAHSDREWLLVHPAEGICEVSAGAPALLGVESRTEIDREHLREKRPELAEQLTALVAEPAALHRKVLTVDRRDLTVTATPLELSRSGRAYRLIWLEPETDGIDQYRAQGLMAQRVAHDLKNPLTSILLTLQRMQMVYREEDGSVADTLDEYTERIEERIASLRRMTTNVLKFAGKENLRRTPTDLSDFLEELGESLEQNLPPDIEMRRQLAEDLPVTAVDQDQMRSVIENLVANAVEAMHEGGVLTLSTRLARALYFDDDATARDFVVVEVLDTGVGMTAREQERLYEPGFSTRDDTGLGMALVQKIIDDHEGQIEVESEPDVGTSITLYLPTDVDASTSAS